MEQMETMINQMDEIAKKIIEKVTDLAKDDLCKFYPTVEDISAKTNRLVKTLKKYKQTRLIEAMISELRIPESYRAMLKYIHINGNHYEIKANGQLEFGEECPPDCVEYSPLF